MIVIMIQTLDNNVQYLGLGVDHLTYTVKSRYLEL